MNKFPLNAVSLKSQLLTETRPQIILILQSRLSFCDNKLPEYLEGRKKSGRGMPPQYQIDAWYEHEGGDPSLEKLRQAILDVCAEEEVELVNSLDEDGVLIWPEVIQIEQAVNGKELELEPSNFAPSSVPEEVVTDEGQTLEDRISDIENILGVSDD